MINFKGTQSSAPNFDLDELPPDATQISEVHLQLSSESSSSTQNPQIKTQNAQKIRFSLLQLQEATPKKGKIKVKLHPVPLRTALLRVGVCVYVADN